MNNTIVILGAGESGVSAARLGQRHGYDVFVSDYGPGNPKYLEELTAAGIPYEVNGHDRERIFSADEVVKSPGISDATLLIVELRKAGIPVISEIEFADRFRPAGSVVLAITGSNGKTTTTLLTEHLLKESDFSVKAGGNLGDSYARLLVDEPAYDIYVLELSSFQLDGIVDFRPDIAAVLNITPDHLDRYEYNLSTYADAKLRIAMNQGERDDLIVLLEEETLAPALRRRNPSANIIWLSSKNLRGTAIEVDGARFDLSATLLRGRHNALNACFAIRMVQRFGMTDETIQRALEAFRPAAHRMELIPTSDGRTWINDSKATNVDATYFALEAMTGPTVWIAGGTDKGNDYDVLQPLVKRRVRALVCLGADNHKLLEDFGDTITVVECRDVTKAVELATDLSEAGETVLLSPACASFDLFKNYIDRGDQFRAAVQNHHA